MSKAENNESVWNILTSLADAVCSQQEDVHLHPLLVPLHLLHTASLFHYHQESAQVLVLVLSEWKKVLQLLLQILVLYTEWVWPPPGCTLWLVDAIYLVCVCVCVIADNEPVYVNSYWVYVGTTICFVPPLWGHFGLEGHFRICLLYRGHFRTFSFYRQFFGHGDISVHF